MILNVAMMLEISCDYVDLALKIRGATAAALEAGLRTKDIWSEGMVLASTDEISNKIVKNIVYN
jgi:3-isopropylmalate dehydrogenase